ncbi:hypothetical protein DPMN_007112 [Dreissena polymorpha]|uniref:Uncharacterized protein n=1 Tax=Dreissena polymorpha TaxID=45954 RepID=A0A9D4MSP5_DREPO|nr:hypothetical protein DPMN_007112 [Dreissena polymorpha]
MGLPITDNLSCTWGYQSQTTLVVSASATVGVGLPITDNLSCTWGYQSQTTLVAHGVTNHRQP